MALEVQGDRQGRPAAQALLEAGVAASLFRPPASTPSTSTRPSAKPCGHVPDVAMNAQWRHIIHPRAGRLSAAAGGRPSAGTFLTPEAGAVVCRGRWGVTGPDGLLQDLNVQTGVDPQDQGPGQLRPALLRKTPVFSHLTWAVVAAGPESCSCCAGAIRPDWVFVALLAGTLVFVATFAVISVACDYRYLYLLDLAAMVSALYWALDPAARWRRNLGPVSDLGQDGRRGGPRPRWRRGPAGASTSVSRRAGGGQARTRAAGAGFRTSGAGPRRDPGSPGRPRRQCSWSAARRQLLPPPRPAPPGRAPLPLPRPRTSSSTWAR